MNEIIYTSYKNPIHDDFIEYFDYYKHKQTNELYNVEITKLYSWLYFQYYYKVKLTKINNNLDLDNMIGLKLDDNLENIKKLFPNKYIKICNDKFDFFSTNILNNTIRIQVDYYNNIQNYKLY